MNKTKEEQLLYTGILQVKRRDTGITLIENEHGELIHDTISDAYMFDCDSLEEGERWMQEYVPRDCHLLHFLRKDLAEKAYEIWQFPERLECHQAVYESNVIPNIDTSIQILPADDSDISFILENYDKLSKEELQTIQQMHHLFMIYDKEDHQPAGFAGMHLEGSAGLLEILPQYRRKGYGEQMEKFIIARMLEEDLIPFCQVEADNTKSLALQKKLGFTISEGCVYWMFG